MRAVALLVLIVSVLSTRLPAQAPSTVPAGNVENGKKLWVARGCWTCHGYAAHGGVGSNASGPRIVGRVPAWGAFVRAVRQPIRQMVPYTPKVISDQELADIYAWLRAIPAPPALSSIPQLKE